MTDVETIVVNGAGSGEGDNLDNSVASEHDPHFEPIVSLPEVVIPTMEEEEEEMIKLRAKLFRFDYSEKPPEWKDRGTGEVKLLKHKVTSAVRVVMRRDKTLKICANHYVTPWMKLEPNCGSDRAWVWSVKADYALESPSSELLAIRFASAEIAQRWKEKFEEAKEIVGKYVYTNRKEDLDTEDSEDENLNESTDGNNTSTTSEKPEDDRKENEKGAEEVAEKLEKLNVADANDASKSSPE